MGLNACVAPRRGRLRCEPGLESPGYRQDIAPRWEAGDSETASTGTRDVLRLDGVALHEDFAVTQEVLKKMICPPMRQWIDSGHVP